MKVWRSAKNPNSLGKKPQTINNRWLDSKVDNMQLSPQQPLYSFFKRNCHLHCNALESNFSLIICYSTILLRFNSVALVCCIITAKQYDFVAESKPVRQTFQTYFQLSYYGDITGGCQALLYIFTFWNANMVNNYHINALRGDPELLKSAPNLQCMWQI